MEANYALGLARLAAAVGDLGNGGFGDFEFGICRADRKRFFFDDENDAHNASRGHYFVAGPDGLEQFGMVLGFFLLRPDKGEVKHDHHQSDHWEARPHWRALLAWLRLRPQGQHCFHVHQSHIALSEPLNLWMQTLLARLNRSPSLRHKNNSTAARNS